MEYKLFADGSCHKNPGGQAAYGYILYGDNEEIDHGFGIIGSGARMNNNLAECFAISQGLSSFIKHWNEPESSLTIYNDSKYVLSQVKNPVKGRNIEIEFKILDFQIRQIEQYLDVYLVWVPRSGNLVADALSKRLRNPELPKAYSGK